MPFDDHLAARIREQLEELPGYTERTMFGGLCFMLNGNMCAGVVGSTLMLRVGPEQHDAAIARPYARPMDFTGRPMKGMIYVDPEGITRTPDLEKWLALAVAYVGAQPAKIKTPKKARKR